MGAKDQVTPIVAVGEATDLLANCSGLQLDALRLPVKGLGMRVIKQRPCVVKSELVQALAFKEVQHTAKISSGRAGLITGTPRATRTYPAGVPAR
jgi:hypothetical protein